MPPPKKLDLVPDELRQRLAQLLQDRGFGDLMDVTDELNSWLEERGEQLTIGKSAVGEFSKLLKDQRDAFAMAETMLADLDIEGESNMHKVLMQMIATAAFQMMQSMSEKDEDFDPKSLANLSRMLKDLMQSAGMREKLREDERRRVEQKVREAAVEDIEKVATQLGMTKDTVQGIREQILFGGKQ
jgi:hypothetical protein